LPSFVTGKKASLSILLQLAYSQVLIRLWLHYDHKNDGWRLFVDSLKRSLKEVLPHNGSTHCLAVHTKETYENLLDKINYNKHCRKASGDLKIVAILLGLQSGYTNCCCFIWESDSKANDKHYSVKHSEKHKKLTSGERNVVHDPVVHATKLFLPPLHIKLGLVKTFVKVMKKGDPVSYICSIRVIYPA
jgi:hypothetical protein